MRLGATPGTRPGGRHTSPPSRERSVEARERLPPASAGASCHLSSGGFPHSVGARLGRKRAAFLVGLPQDTVGAASGQAAQVQT